MSDEKKPGVVEWVIAIVIFIVAMALLTSVVALPLWWVATMTLRALNVAYDAKLLLIPAYAVAIAVLCKTKVK